MGVSRQEHEAFFGEMLGDVDEPTAPFGLVDVQGDGSGVGESRQLLDRDVSRRLRAKARALGVSAASICHVAWGLVLARCSGQQDPVFGTVLFGRMQGGTGADRVLGLFINTLPVRVRLGDLSVERSVLETHQLLARLLRHEHAPLVLAQRCSGVPAPAPLFTALFNYRHSGVAADKEGSRAQVLEGIRYLGSEERTNYPVTLSVDDLGQEFGLTAQTVLSQDPRRLCAMMHRALEQLVDALESNPTHPVGRLDILPAEERHKLLVAWNATEAAYPSSLCVHELFEEQAERAFEALAVVYEDHSLTYGELNRQANRLAHHLRALGVRPDSRVWDLRGAVAGDGGRPSCHSEGGRSLCSAGPGLSGRTLKLYAERQRACDRADAWSCQSQPGSSSGACAQPGLGSRRQQRWPRYAGARPASRCQRLDHPSHHKPRPQSHRPHPP